MQFSELMVLWKIDGGTVKNAFIRIYPVNEKNASYKISKK